MATRKVRFRAKVWQAQYLEGSLPLERVARLIGGKSRKLRVSTVSAHPYFMHEFHEPVIGGDRFVRGNLVRMQRDNNPSKGNVLGELHSLGLKAGEGVTEEAAFLYHCPTGVLLLESRPYLRETGFEAYFCASKWTKNIPGDCTFELVPVAVEGELKAMKDWARTTKIHVNVAQPKVADLKRSPADSAKDMRRMGASKLEIKMSLVGEGARTTKSMETGFAIKWLNAMSALGAKIRAEGESAEGDPELIDLAGAHLDYIAYEHLEGRERLSYGRRRLLLQDAWNEHADDLLEWYGE